MYNHNNDQVCPEYNLSINEVQIDKVILMAKFKGHISIFSIS